MARPEDFDTYEDYVAYHDYEKRMGALAKSKQNIADDQRKYSAASDSGMENFKAGIGAGMVGVADRAVNLLLPKALERGRFTSDAINERKRMEQDLTDTGAGSAGKMVGEFAATLPLTAGAGALGKAALGASRTASGARLAAALSRPTGYAARAASAGLEGAGQSLLTSGPDEGLKEAVIGGALGAGMGLAGKAVGQVARKMRPEVTDEARGLMKEMVDTYIAQAPEHLKNTPEKLAALTARAEKEAFIPLSHALPKGSNLRMGYEGIAANLPISGQAIRGQHEAAIGGVREALMSKAAPHGVDPASVFDREDTMKNAFSALKGHWDDAYNDVYKASVPGVKLPQDVAEEIQRRSGGSIKHTGDLTGREVLDLTQSLQELINETPKGPLSKAARSRMIGLKEGLEKKLTSTLPEEIAAGFEKNKEAYKTYQALLKAGRAAPGGEFSLRQAERQLAKRGAAGEDLALTGTKVLPSFPSRQGVFQMLAATGAVGAAAGAAGYSGSDPDDSIGKKLLNAGLGIAAAAAGAKYFSTPAGQKLIAQYGKQGALDKYAEALAQAGKVGRAGVQLGRND